MPHRKRGSEVEAALDASHRRYAALFERARDAILVLDGASFQIVELNLAAERLLAYRRDELVGRSVEVMYTPDSWPGVLEHLKRVPKVEGTTWIVPRTDLRRRDGTLVPVEIHASIVALGERKLMQGMVRDLSERQRSDDRFERLNRCFLSFGADPEQNVMALLTACGEELGATRLRYSVIDGGMLRSIAWNGEPRIASVDAPSEVLAFEAMREEIAPRVIACPAKNAPGDPDVAGMTRGISACVRVGGECVGALTILFETAVEPTVADLSFAGLIAGAVGVEEERRGDLRALRASEGRFRAMNEASPLGIFVMSKQGDMVYHNARYLEICGLTEEQAIGGEWIVCIHPDDIDKVTRAWRQVVETQRDVEIVERMVHSDGELVWASVKVAPILGKGGAVTGFLGTVDDITLAVQAEEQHRRDAELRRQIGRVARIGGFELDPVRETFRFSDEVFAIYELAPAESIAMAEALAFHADEDRLSLITALKQAVEDGGAFDIDVPLVTAKGRRAWTRWFGEAGIGYGGVRVAGAVQDVTERHEAELERRRLESQIQHAQKLESLGVLAGGIAHDFNNLLTSILGNVSLASLDMPEGHRAHRSLEQAELAARRAADLTRQMLAYSGRGRFVLERLEPSRVISEMVGLLKSVISKKVDLVLDLEPTPAIVGDVAQIQQVVMNLITNAAEAVGERSGRVVVRARTELAHGAELASMALGEGLEGGTYALLEVEDDGCGMDDDTLGRVFEPFFTTKFTGRGLGLSAVLGIVRSHRGAIHVASRAGVGTTFRVLFPCELEAKKDGGPIVRPPSTRPMRGRLLVVDDEDTVLSFLERLLSRAGFDVCTAGDGSAAIARLDELASRGDQAALVLLDLTMPVMDGREVLDALRKRGDSTPIIVMSGFHEQEVSEQLAGLAFDGVLQKPFGAGTVVEEVGRVIESRLLGR